tara:strand:- start:24068 stop:24424 length:357 start_codon:yes stop_codon:yes gene_type:complete
MLRRWYIQTFGYRRPGPDRKNTLSDRSATKRGMGKPDSCALATMGVARLAKIAKAIKRYKKVRKIRGMLLVFPAFFGMSRQYLEKRTRNKITKMTSKSLLLYLLAWHHCNAARCKTPT